MYTGPPHFRAPLVPIYRLKIKCPICGKPDNCSIREDRTAVFCRRVQSDRPGHNGWTHILSDISPPQRPIKRPQPATIKEVPLASIERRDAVFEALLYKQLILAKEHKTKSLMRGLDAAEIQCNGYASLPPPAFASSLARSLAAQYELKGVPGFYLDGGEWQLNVRNGDAGMFIPVRDPIGHIQALLIRRDDATDGRGKYIWLSSKGRPKGASSGAPVHFAKPYKLHSASEVVITEGALKADVVAYLTSSPVVGIAGVSTFSSDFASHLRETFPNLRRVSIAYDRDLLEKEEVYSALMRLTTQLERACFQVRIRTWPPPAKGYDDYLLSQLTRKGVAA